MDRAISHAVAGVATVARFDPSTTALARAPPRTPPPSRSDRPAASRARVSTACSTPAGTVSRSVRERRRPLGHHLGDDRLHARAGERRLAGEHLVRHGAERVDVARARRSCARPSPARATCTAACRARGRSASCAAPPACCTASAMPKSATSACPSCSRMFSGLMSRWMTPCAMRVVERVGDLARDAHRVVDRQLPLALEPRRAASRPSRAASRSTAARPPRRESSSGRMCGCCSRAVVRISREKALAAERRAEIRDAGP